MTFYWWANQAGIIFEIVGALLIVYTVFRTRKIIKDVKNTYDSDLAIKLRGVLSNQTFRELRGFMLLAIGITMQVLA